MGKDKSKKRKRRASEDDDYSSSTDSEAEKKKLRKLKKKLKKETKKASKAIKKTLKKAKKMKKHKDRHSPSRNRVAEVTESPKAPNEETTTTDTAVSADIPIELMEKSKAMAPMTKEEWEKRQSVVRRVYDEESGRHRLIKGDGEVLEEIVSKERHEAINRSATQADGAYFQSRTIPKHS